MILEYEGFKDKKRSKGDIFTTFEDGENNVFIINRKPTKNDILRLFRMFDDMYKENGLELMVVAGYTEKIIEVFRDGTFKYVEM